MSEQRMATQMIDHGADAVIATNPQVVALRNIVGEDHLEFSPIRVRAVSNTLRSRFWASSTMMKASVIDRPRMWVSGRSPAVRDG